MSDGDDDFSSPRPSAPRDKDVLRTNPQGGSNFEDDSVVGKSGMPTLFSLIGKFQPEPGDISVHYKPFILDLITEIRAIDAFIKVPRPDGDMDDL
jgi:intraflagellar transport protein 46